MCFFIGHDDKNYADEDMHYAYCARCGKVFGRPWLSDKENKRAFDALRDMTLEEAATLCDLQAEGLRKSDSMEAEQHMTLVLAAGSIRRLKERIRA